jgi:hypothetical protein
VKTECPALLTLFANGAIGRIGEHAAVHAAKVAVGLVSAALLSHHRLAKICINGCVLLKPMKKWEFAI